MAGHALLPLVAVPSVLVPFLPGLLEPPEFVTVVPLFETVPPPEVPAEPVRFEPSLFLSLAFVVCL